MENFKDYPPFLRKSAFKKYSMDYFICFDIGIFIIKFYFVGPAEVGIVKRFGKIVAVHDPGLHWKLPFIDQAIKWM